VTQPPDPPVVNLVAEEQRADRRNPLEPAAVVSRSLVPVPVEVAPVSEPSADADLRRGDVDAWGRSERVRAIARAVYDPMYRYWFRAEWEGLENVPTDGGALIVANHAAAIPSDAPVIMHGLEVELQRAVYGLAENLFRALPVVGTLWSRTGGVPAHPDNAYRLLHDEQQLVLVFPEGAKGTGKHYRDRYKLRRFGRGGFVEIAMRAGVPIVPIAVVGAEESMPILWKSKRLAALLNLPYFPITANTLLLGPAGLVTYFPAKFKLRVLPPIHLDAEPDQERYSRSRVMEESEKIREQIQVALYDMLRTRRSVWFG
jgi:1-acyl-sn-glycerol-3-phosphate acyltransferase